MINLQNIQQTAQSFYEQERTPEDARIRFSLPHEMLEDIDKVRNSTRQSRSAYIRTCVINQ